MGLFSGFGARRQENQELQALAQVSRSIMSRITAQPRPRGQIGPSQFILEPPEIAAISAGLMSKAAHPRNRALQLLENVENIGQIEGQIVQALFLSDDFQVKSTCLERDIPRIDPKKAMAVFSRMARDPLEAEKLRSVAARQTVKCAQFHPDGVTIIADLIEDKTPAMVISPILQNLLATKLDPIILDKIMNLRTHPELQAVAEAFQFLSLHSVTKLNPQDPNHVARFVDSKQGGLFRAQIHAGLVSMNAEQRCAACALIAKDPRVAENTLTRLIEIQEGLFSNQRDLRLKLFSVQSNRVANILFPPEGNRWRRFIPDIESQLSVRQLWTHALGYAAAHQPYNPKVIDLLELRGKSSTPRPARSTNFPPRREETNLSVFTVWHDLLLGCKNADSLHASLLKRYSVTPADSSSISDAFRTTCEISEWTGPMELDCGPAFVKCLNSNNADVRAYTIAIIAGLGSKIKNGAQLVTALPKVGLEAERMFEPLIHASAAPESPGTTLLIKKALMDSAASVARAAVVAAARIGKHAVQLQGELTLLAFSEDETTSQLAREALSNLGVHLKDKDTGPDNFFSLRMAG